MPWLSRSLVRFVVFAGQADWTREQCDRQSLLDLPGCSVDFAFNSEGNPLRIPKAQYLAFITKQAVIVNNVFLNDILARIVTSADHHVTIID